MLRIRVISLATASLLVLLASACGSNTPPEVTTGGETPAEATTGSETAEKEFEDFDHNNLDDRSTNIDNEWLPLQPGTHFVYEGTTTEDGESFPHRLEFTVTDLTKEIEGVHTVVAWVEDYSDGELVELEVAFYAQDNDGNVWYLGEYPEEYEDGEFVAAPTWIHGLDGARAGIMMKAEPQLGAPSYSQGWGPAVDFRDRGQVSQMGQETCVPVDCYEDALVIEEFTLEEPDAFQLKYYARGVGNVRVGWRGADETQEELELVELVQLDPEALAEVRAMALQLEKHAYQRSKDVYAHTSPAAASQGSTTAEASVPGAKEGEDAMPGTEEFGMTEEELVQSAEAVEALIATCMSDAGFEYVPVDYATVRKAMDADKTAPGLTTEEYAATFGYGISTQPPAGASNPAIIGLGEQNMQISNSLSEADQDAYNHTLFGENTDATFAVSLEAEDFSETGGCTRTAIEQVFSPEELNATYYNPGDTLIEQDPRVIAAIAAWSDCMREAGFNYDSPEEIEEDLRDRLDAVLKGADFETLSAPAQAELTALQGEERAIAVADLECELKFIEPAVRQVETELYGAPKP